MRTRHAHQFFRVHEECASTPFRPSGRWSTMRSVRRGKGSRPLSHFPGAIMPETPSIEVHHGCLYKIPFARIARCAVAYEHQLLDGRGGIDVVTGYRDYPLEARPTPAAHVARLRSEGLLGEGL